MKKCFCPCFTPLPSPIGLSTLVLLEKEVVELGMGCRMRESTKGFSSLGGSSLPDVPYYFLSPYFG